MKTKKQKKNWILECACLNSSSSSSSNSVFIISSYKYLCNSIWRIYVCVCVFNVFFSVSQKNHNKLLINHEIKLMMMMKSNVMK